MAIELWPHGVCPAGKTGPGGWSFIALSGGRKLAEDAGTVPETTAVRVQLEAAIRGLEAVPAGSECMVLTGCQYLAYSMIRGWPRRANADLWRRLDAAVAWHADVAWRYVRRGAGFGWCERADWLAREAARSPEG